MTATLPQPDPAAAPQPPAQALDQTVAAAHSQADVPIDAPLDAATHAQPPGQASPAPIFAESDAAAAVAHEATELGLQTPHIEQATQAVLAPAASASVAAPASGPNLAQTAALLAQHFPALFGPGPAKPIKLRVQADIQARAPGLFSKKALSIFLHRHTTSTAYLKALVAAPSRFNLDGVADGDIANEHREAAQQEVQRRREIVQGRIAAQRQAQRAQGPQHAQHPQHPPGQEGFAAAPGQTDAGQAAPAGAQAAPGQRPRPQRDGRPPRTDRPARQPQRAPSERAEHSGAPHHLEGQRRGPGQGHGQGQGLSHGSGQGHGSGARQWQERRPGSRNERPQTQGPADGRRFGPRPERQDWGQGPASPGGRDRDRGADAPQLAWPQDPAQRERAQLLRAFEASPLTPANFSALKGLKLADFEAQVSLAQQERKAQRAAAAAAAAPPRPVAAVPPVAMPAPLADPGAGA